MSRMPPPYHAGAVALENGRQHWTFAELDHLRADMARQFSHLGTRVLATLLDNGPAWVVADAAARDAAVVHVPLPAFFTPAQIAHALAVAGVDTVLTVPAAAARWPQAPAIPCCVAGQELVLLRLPATAVAMPAGTAKITFTSGTTGTPKGVCLGAAAMDRVAEGLVQALAPLDIRRHLCALPLAVLLENIAGLMAPLRQGATCITLPLAELGLSGSSSFDVARFDATVQAQQPHSLILLPQMLRAWTAWLTATGARAPGSLRLVAVGGAAVGPPLLAAARALGIPAYEGYGLSEGASVQTLNLPGRDRPGSAGAALPHAQLRIAADGEIEVAGSLFSGYLGQATPVGPWWPTGDLGRLDADGFLHVDGRKKHVLITAFGRNVAPEWVETALGNEAAIAQAVVLGDGQPFLSAVLWPVTPATSNAQLQAAIDAANLTLPDYAQIHHWCRGQAPFTSEFGMATANGRPRREVVRHVHASALGLEARGA